MAKKFFTGDSWESFVDTIKSLLAGKSDIDHTHSVVSTTDNGFAPVSPGGTAKYLRADGTWATPPNTNTKVTAVGNHYTPAKSKTISADSTTAATWGSTDMVTGIEMDAAGHVTGVTSIQMPANPNTDTNTTYDLAASASSTNGNVKLNLTAGGSGSGTDSVFIKGSGATTVTTDSNGVITISSTDTNTDTKYTHPTYTARTGVPTADATLSHGGTFTVTQPVSDGTGHITAMNTRTYTLPTDNNSAHSHSAGVGLVGSGNAGTSGTYTYKAKLRDETALTVDSSAATTTSGRVYPVAVDKTGYLAVNVPWTDNNTVYTHPTHTAVTGVPTANATPAFGDTFNVNQITNNNLGHVTANTSRTITIPSTLSNGTGTAGLIKTTSTVTSNSGYTACPVINGVPYYKDTDSNTDTKNTAGSTNSSSKLFLIGATSQAANPQTYSHDTAYVGTDGCLYSNSTKVSVEGHTHTGYATSDHTHTGYVNQNAFSNITVGSTTIAADSTTDTLTLVAGSNITLTPDATNDKVTIAATDTKYTHPTTSGNKHIPSGGSSGQILRWSADGTAAWGADNNTTYGVVSTTADGLAPKRDGSTTKFLRADGTWAVPPDNNTVYTHPAYTARTGVPTANASPAFGGTFTVSQPTSDATGHVTAINSRTITIPSTAASASAAGLVNTGTQTFAGAKTFNSQITASGGVKIGSATLVYDSTAGALKVTFA